MATTRTRDVQQQFVFRTWGGKRTDAGRPQVNPRKSQPHRSRPNISPTHPIHVTLRVAPAIARLRQRSAYQAIRKAMQVVLGRSNFRIVHVSIQGNHLHLIIEAEHKRALSKGLQAFQISAAQRLNRAQLGADRRGRRGRVFVDRYHAEVLTTPRQTHHALSYVLNNWRHHNEDRARSAQTWYLDPFSSAVTFTGWAEKSEWRAPSGYDVLPVCRPQSWLLYEGWRLGGEISVFGRPGARPRRRREPE